MTKFYIKGATRMYKDCLIDENPEIASDDVLRRLKRVRETTHEEIYDM